MALDFARLAISRPILLGISQVTVEDGPPIGGFAILDAGDRKAEFAAIVSKLEAMTGQEVVDAEVGSLKMRQFKENDEVPLYWGWVGNHLRHRGERCPGGGGEVRVSAACGGAGVSGQTARQWRRPGPALRLAEDQQADRDGRA